MIDGRTNRGISVHSPGGAAAHSYARFLGHRDLYCAGGEPRAALAVPPTCTAGRSGSAFQTGAPGLDDLRVASARTPTRACPRRPGPRQRTCL